MDTVAKANTIQKAWLEKEQKNESKFDDVRDRKQNHKSGLHLVRVEKSRENFHVYFRIIQKSPSSKFDIDFCC